MERDLSLVAGISFVVDHAPALADATLAATEQAEALLLHLPLAGDEPWRHLEQATARLPRLPVIVLADDGDFTVAREALRRGARDYLLVSALTQRPLVQALLGAVERRPTEDAAPRADEAMSDAEWAATFDAVEDAIMVLDRDRKVVRANRAAEKLFGTDVLYKEPCYTLCHGSSQPLAGCTVDRTFRTGGTSHLEFKEAHLGGQWFSMSAYPLKTQGTVDRVVHVLRNISEARDAAHYQRILDAKQLVNKELEELNEMKSQFLEVSAHEMRTPMAVIRSGVDLLLGGSMGPLTERQEEFMCIVARNIDRLSRFATDVLNLARLDAGRYTVTVRDLDLEESINHSLNTVKEAAEEKNTSLSLSLDEKVSTAQADPDALEQVMFNLLSNAVMHCPPRSSVQVKATAPMEDKVEISVEDDGPGIPEAELPRIFDRFYQVDRQDGPGYGGTGIGLTIARALVERMGGELSVRSTKDNGTTFTFTLRTRQHPREILFGRIAQNLGFVDPAQVQSIVNAQMTDKVDKKIGQLMEEAGLLTAQQVEMVLRLQQDSLSRPHPSLPSTVGESLMGHLAVKHGFISEEQLFECVAIQSRQMEEGQPARLGLVLQEKGYMTADEIAMVLQIQKMVTPQV